jgi:hypothetical protein
MFKKTSKYIIFSSVLLVFSLLLVSCQSLIASTEEMDRKRAMDAWGANLTAQGQSYFEEMNRFRAIDAWGANLTAQGERYLEEMERGYNGSLMVLSTDAPSGNVVVVDASSPRIEIRHIRVQARTFMTVYTVTSDGPGWIVLHADQDGAAGAILENIWVPNGTTRIVRTNTLEEMGSEPIHVMLHYDHGWTGYFEFPRTDGPVLVDQEMVDELCLCSY